MGFAFPAVNVAAAETSDALAPSAVKDIMRRACDYQLRIQAEDRATTKADINYEWVRGAFYTGEMVMTSATGDMKYQEAALKYGNDMKWQLAKPDTRHADWQCVGQMFLEMYMIKHDPTMMAGIKANIDRQMADPKPGRVDWWWCDSLYMCPPVLTRLAAATGDHKYIDYLNTMYWDTVDYLYNPKEHLFYRDKNFFDKRTKNGKEVYWSRGNGWVLAGLARLMDYLPKDDASRPKFEKLFKDMANRIAEFQGDDGLWRTSLLDPDDFKTSETSGSAFFTYAMAWGVNNGLLERAKFEPVAKKGWVGLTHAVTPEGKLGYVQAVAAAPGEVKPGDTREYAVGAFLLAGNEILKMEAVSGL
jgi:rhamnogalacturonyl hydrolase YesR